MNLMMPRPEDYTRCRGCGARFSVLRGDNWEAPARSLAMAYFAAVFAGLTGYAAWFLQSPARLSLSCFALLVVVFYLLKAARSARRCRNQGGGVCPQCGVENPVRLWAL